MVEQVSFESLTCLHPSNINSTDASFTSNLHIFGPYSFRMPVNRLDHAHCTCAPHRSPDEKELKFFISATHGIMGSLRTERESVDRGFVQDTVSDVNTKAPTH